MGCCLRQRFSPWGEIHSEMEKIILTDKLVDRWTYPLIQPKLIAEAQRRGYGCVFSDYV